MTTNPSFGSQMETTVEKDLDLKAYLLSKDEPYALLVPVREYENPADNTLYDYSKLCAKFGWHKLDQIHVENTEHLVLFDADQRAQKGKGSFWVNGKQYQGCGILLRGHDRGSPLGCNLSMAEVMEISKPR